MEDLDAYWLAKGTEQLKQARAGEPAIGYDVTGLPDTWLAAELLTFDEGTEWELGVTHIIDMAHVLAVKPSGDVVVLLEAARGTTGDAQIAALEAAWRACFAPELAAVIEALDAQRDAPAMPVAKKKRDTEVLWGEAAKTAIPRSLFAGEWPKTWRDAQRRMRPLYQRPRSPLFAAAALDFTKRDPLPYTSIASTTYWQAHAWFIAEQGDVRQLDALLAFEARLAPMWGERRIASDALRAFAPRPLPGKATALLAKLAVPAKPTKTAAISLASPEERAVAADQLQLAGDPRGELITVQEAIAKQPTPALIKRQAQLVKKHAKTWVPGTVYRNTCVFRGGVPVAGHLIARSDPELASMAGSQALATFETLIIDDAFAMGDITGETIAKVVASLPALRTLRTTEAGARAVARGAPTTVEHLVLDSPFKATGPGLPKLRRVDLDDVTSRPDELEVLGTRYPALWTTLRNAGLDCMVVFTDGLEFLHRRARTEPTPWELWADRKGTVTARPQVGSTAESLAETLDRVSWNGVKKLRVPKNFSAAVNGVEIVEAPAIDPHTLGISLDLV